MRRGKETTIESFNNLILIVTNAVKNTLKLLLGVELKFPEPLGLPLQASLLSVLCSHQSCRAHTWRAGNRSHIGCTSAKPITQDETSLTPPSAMQYPQ